MANINPTPPKQTPSRVKLDHSRTGHKGPQLTIQTPKKDDLAWRRIVKYLSIHQRTVEEEYLLIEKKESKLPSILRLYIEIYINYNLQLEQHLNQPK